MRPFTFLCAFIAFAASVIAAPAVDRVPTAINQAATDPGQGAAIANIVPIAGNPPRGPDLRFPIPNTDTILYIARGDPVERASVQILLGRLQFDLRLLISQYGSQGIPRRQRTGHQGFTFPTRTPMGKECSFFINTFKDQPLSYAMISEAVVGLKAFMVEQKQFSDLFFRVDVHRNLRATGGISCRQGLAPSNTNSESFPLTLGNNDKITIKCTWGDALDEKAIKDVLEDARTKVRVMTYSQGLDHKMPGAAGEWSTEGQFHAKFSIAGKPPAHLTWGNMGDAVQEFSFLIANHIYGNAETAGKEATCEVMADTTVVGTLSVTKG